MLELRGLLLFGFTRNIGTAGLHLCLPGFALYLEPRIGWFRFAGYGLHWKDVRFHRPLFSERMGLAVRTRLWNWSVGKLTPGGQP